jgi:hypothetical protein
MLLRNRQSYSRYVQACARTLSFSNNTLTNASARILYRPFCSFSHFKRMILNLVPYTVSSRDSMAFTLFFDDATFPKRNERYCLTFLEL